MNELLQSMLEVEDFIRLMLGEVMRNDETALAVGHELINSTQESLERWIAEDHPELQPAAGAAAVARMLRAMLIGAVLRARGRGAGRREPERRPAPPGRGGGGHPLPG